MRLPALVLVALLLPWTAVSALPSQPSRCASGIEGAVGEARAFAYTEDPGAGKWPTWHVKVGDVVVPAPPGALSARAAEERAELRLYQAQRTAEQQAVIDRFDEGPASRAWEILALDMVAKWSPTDPGLNPPRVARHLAILETAMHDALVLAWEAKYCYRRAPPAWQDPTLLPTATVRAAPSYPSEHAVAAGVASVLFPQMFPYENVGTFANLAEDAAMSRLWAGASYRSDVEAGLELGRAVAQLTLAARADDGSATPWDGSGRITGTCNWSPTPPAYKPSPLEPNWGKVRPFLMPSGSALRPPPPPACDSPDYRGQVADLYLKSQTLTDDEKAIALKWAGGPGTVTPPGMAMQAALRESDARELTTMQHARVMSYTGAAVADAGIAAWDAKFAYWGDRPVNGVRRWHDPAWTSFIATPPFPGYVSGHSTFSGAAAATLAHFFPEREASLWAEAQEAAVSRYYGGIHLQADNEAGLEVGRAIGALAAARAT